MTVDPSGGLSEVARQAAAAAAGRMIPADEVLMSDGLGHKHVSIQGMGNFFTYQLEYKQVWPFVFHVWRVV